MQSEQEQNKALLQRWFDEVWNEGRSETIDELMAPHCTAGGLGDTPEHVLKGPAEFKPFYEKFRGAFPNIKVAVEDLIAEGDKVAARCSVRATHTGDHLGVPASNAPVIFDGIAIVRIADGKFVESWNSFDFLTMNKQIGAL